MGQCLSIRIKRDIGKQKTAGKTSIKMGDPLPRGEKGSTAEHRRRLIPCAATSQGLAIGQGAATFRGSERNARADGPTHPAIRRSTDWETHNMITLYFMPGACSTVANVALEWIGAPYELVKMERSALKSPEFLKINPAGSVPALVEDGFAVTENAAIMDYLDDQYPKSGIFGGQSVKQKAEGRRWFAFVNSDIHPSFGPLFAKDQVGDQAVQFFTAKLKRLYGIADKQLADRPYLSGHKSVADVYLYVTMTWAKAMGLDLGDLKNLEAHFQRMEQDEGVKDAKKAQADA